MVLVYGLGDANAARVTRTFLRCLPARLSEPFAWVAATLWDDRWKELGSVMQPCRPSVGGVLLHLNSQCRGCRFFWFSGFWERRVSEWIRRRALASNGGCFVDVGANYGYFTAFWLAVRGNSARCLAIEPVPKFVSLLRQSFGGIPNVIVAPVALGENAGVVRFLNDPTMCGHVITGSNDEPGIDPMQVSQAATINVDMLPLSELLESNGFNTVVDCLKIDAEGYDLKIIGSSWPLFEAHRILSVVWERDDDSSQQEAIEARLGKVGYFKTLDTGDYVGFELAEDIQR